jgi:hypothetical protein
LLRSLRRNKFNEASSVEDVCPMPAR